MALMLFDDRRCAYCRQQCVSPGGSPSAGVGFMGWLRRASSRPRDHLGRGLSLGCLLDSLLFEIGPTDPGSFGYRDGAASGHRPPPRVRASRGRQEMTRALVSLVVAILFASASVTVDAQDDTVVHVDGPAPASTSP